MTIDEMKDRALRDALNTVGYAESDNHAEFKKGAEIALGKIQQYISDELMFVHSVLETARNSNQETQEDMRTMVNILEKYSTWRRG